MTPTEWLETDEYLEAAWRRSVPCPLISLRGDFDVEIFAEFSEQHEHWCKDSDSLCTGDGFRWKPTLPALRFA